MSLKGKVKLSISKTILRPHNPIYCARTNFNFFMGVQDFCLELSKIKVLKMLDLQKKSAINSELYNIQFAFRLIL